VAQAYDCFSSKPVKCRSKCRDTKTQAAGGLPKSLNSAALIETDRVSTSTLAEPYRSCSARGGPEVVRL